MIEADLFRASTRAALGLREPDGTTPGDAPELWRLGTYRATVKAAASDGSTVDVQPEDPRLSQRGEGMQAIPLRQPFPGAVVVPTTGSTVRIGWESGREDRPYADLWLDGGASKIVINGTLVIAGAETGAEFVALSNLVTARLNELKAAIQGWTPVPNDGGAALKVALTALFLTWPTTVAASRFKAA